MPRYAVAFTLLILAFAATAQTRDRATRVAAAAAASEPRHALVIGNSAYTMGALKNPVNDARAMAKALSAAGFSVRLLEDASLVGMQRAVRQWGNDLAQGGIGLFYYAGHGIQVKSRNYLVPVNAEIEQEDEIEFNSLDVNQVLAKMDSAKNTLNIVILDACRNNPFARSFRVSANGLAQMDAPTGSFVAFATAPGATAADGASGENGIYTRHLLAELNSPGAPIEQVFKRVRNAVMADTRGLQVPWESSSLRGEFFFVAGSPSTAMVTVAEMEKTIQEALNKQRAALEAQGMTARDNKRPEKTPLASAAPSPAADPRSARLPSYGDTWTYRLVEPNRAVGPKERSYIVTASAASPGAILEEYIVEGEPPQQWVHSDGAYMVNLGVSLVSPYLLAFRDLWPGQSLGALQILDPSCTQLYVTCEGDAKVIGRETVRVPAGSFETVKVRFQHLWRPPTSSGFGTIGFGGRDIMVWYAPAAKRAVKISSRVTAINRGAPVEAHFDLELMSYQVK